MSILIKPHVLLHESLSQVFLSTLSTLWSLGTKRNNKLYPKFIWSKISCSCIYHIWSPMVNITFSRSPWFLQPTSSIILRQSICHTNCFLLGLPWSHQTHIDIHIVREEVTIGFIKILPITSSLQLADLFTKPLPPTLLTSISSS